VIDDEDDAEASKDPSPFSSCVVVMVEIFTEAAMGAAEWHGFPPRRWLWSDCLSLSSPSLNRLLTKCFKVSGCSVPNMPLGPSQRRSSLMKCTLWRVVRPGSGHTDGRQNF
jgi:hypothetical protein